MSDRTIYHKALAELERTAIQFSDAMLRASAAAQLVDPRGSQGDDPEAVRAFATCQEHLRSAFAKAPAMIQLLGGK